MLSVTRTDLGTRQHLKRLNFYMDGIERVLYQRLGLVTFLRAVE